MVYPSVRRFVRVAMVVCIAVTSVPVLALELFKRSSQHETPRAVGAVLDLSGWNSQRDGPVSLAGEWAFYPGELFDAAEARASVTTTSGTIRLVPDLWHGAEAGGASGMGAGTYCLRVLLDGGQGELGIRTPTISTAYELDVNGVKIAHAGRPALSARDAIPGCFTEVCRIPTSTSPRELDIVVRVSNHEYRVGGMWRAFVLGSEDGLLAGKRIEDGLTFAFLGATFATAIVFFLLFRYRRRDRDNLYFASFVLAISLRTLVTGDFLLAGIFPSLPFDILMRLFYLAAFVAVPLGILFFGNVFPEEIPARMQKLVCTPFCILALTLATPLPILTRSIYLFYPLLIVSFILIVFGLARAALRRRSGGVSMLAASILLTIAGISDMLSTSFLFRVSSFLLPALAVFIFVQASVLAKRFSAAFDSVERLSGELVRVNDGLDRKVRERTKELEDAYTQIKELSIKDPLTGAYNRRYLDRELVREIERAHRYSLPLSVLFCDLDHFKAINDRFGHKAGDEVLRAFSRIVFEAIREKVDWFARYGGEEFLVVAPGTRPENALNLAERLRSQAEAAAVESENGLVSYTLSIGVAGLEIQDLSNRLEHADAEAIALSLIGEVDVAMYAAKAGGRNRVELAPR
jgi:diguanylate cyclase (GGDEF)-like protein